MKPLFVIIGILFVLNIKSQNIASTDTLMALIPTKEYTMGKDSERGLDFSPAHRVLIDSFYMDKYPVTNGDYLKFCIETGKALPEFWNTEIFRSGDNYLNYPVVGINWFDAKKYATWAGKRLPTEAEWEYAARGGLIDNEYPDGNEWAYGKCKQDTTGWQNLISPVGTRSPNAYGLYDMAGNVWEWCMDGYAEDYYQKSPTDNPTGPAKATCRVLRGGSWHSGGMCKKVYYRKGLPSNWCDFTVGFRCAKSME